VGHGEEPVLCRHPDARPARGGPADRAREGQSAAR
jgi:hypothetical protein